MSGFSHYTTKPDYFNFYTDYANANTSSDIPIQQLPASKNSSIAPKNGRCPVLEIPAETFNYIFAPFFTLRLKNGRPKRTACRHVNLGEWYRPENVDWPPHTLLLVCKSFYSSLQGLAYSNLELHVSFNRIFHNSHFQEPEVLRELAISFLRRLQLVPSITQHLTFVTGKITEMTLMLWLLTDESLNVHRVSEDQLRVAVVIQQPVYPSALSYIPRVWNWNAPAFEFWSSYLTFIDHPKLLSMEFHMYKPFWTPTTCYPIPTSGPPPGADDYRFAKQEVMDGIRSPRLCKWLRDAIDKGEVDFDWEVDSEPPRGIFKRHENQRIPDATQRGQVWGSLRSLEAIIT